MCRACTIIIYYIVYFGATAGPPPAYVSETSEILGAVQKIGENIRSSATPAAGRLGRARARSRLMCSRGYYLSRAGDAFPRFTPRTYHYYYYYYYLETRSSCCRGTCCSAHSCCALPPSAAIKAFSGTGERARARARADVVSYTMRNRRQKTRRRRAKKTRAVARLYNILYYT